MIHIVGLPHTSLDEHRFSACAFTAKVAKLCRIFSILDEPTTVYWGGKSTPEPVTDFVSCMSELEQRGYFGEYDPAALPVITWDPRLPEWSAFNQRAIRKMRKRLKPGDIIGVIGGSVQQLVVDAFKAEYTIIEPAIGYEGICNDTFACFESYAWMHNRYGAYHIGDGRPMDAVIPNYWNTDDFALADRTEPYAVFIGRMIDRKGPHVAAAIAQRAGIPLFMAGAGIAKNEGGIITCTDGSSFPSKDITLMGYVDPAKRKRLLSKAQVMIVPTRYIGPFEGVHVEAMLSGCPVIAPDHGVFTETIEHGFNGFRYRMLDEAVEAVSLTTKHHFGYEERKDIQAHARSCYSIERCAELYGAWLRRLRTLRDGSNGWYAEGIAKELSLARPYNLH